MTLMALIIWSAEVNEQMLPFAQTISFQDWLTGGAAMQNLWRK